MSVVVRMEIPEKCFNCDLRYECNAFYAPGKPKPFMKGCRIICQLPEGHGDLIDLETAAEGLSERYNSCHMTCGAVMQFLDGLPTIVPEERREE